MTPRVVQIIGSRGGGGAERFYVRLTAALHGAGVPVLAVLPPGSYVDRELPEEVPRARVPMRAVWDLQARWRIRRAVGRFRADVVQTWMGRATRLTRLPRGGRPVHVARLGGYYDVKGYRHAHAWIANTRGIRDYLIAHGLPAGRVFHIANFVEPPAPVETDAVARVRAGLGAAEAPLVLTVARLHPNKGIEDLLRAWREVPPPAVLAVAGDGPERERLRALARELGLEGRVRWLGWQRDPGPLYAACDLVAVPSRLETLGNVVLEAWSHARAVVATHTAGPAELMEGCEGGVLVPPADPRAMARQITRLLGDPARCSRLGANGRAHVGTVLSRDRIVAMYLELYRSLQVT
ncbi:MAG TPA: glycosyltransferase [Chromatiales bacterium]|nr:glycosyltransferase [Chromatiales bacterium]